LPAAGKASCSGGCHHRKEKSGHHPGDGSADHCSWPHKLGRIIREGAAAPNSGVPGIIGGYGAERVLHAQAAGIFRNLHSIADFVEAGEAVAEIETPDGQRLPVATQISGILRGLLRDGYPVTKGFKVADVDPRRAELENCFLISDKARCIAGSVLELIAAECWN